MTQDQENMAMYKMHQMCNEIDAEITNIRRRLWSAVYEKKSPDFNNILLSSIEVHNRSRALLNMAEETRVQSLELDAGA